jgi:hypothetical protein
MADVRSCVAFIPHVPIPRARWGRGFECRLNILFSDIIAPIWGFCYGLAWVPVHVKHNLTVLAK